MAGLADSGGVAEEFRWDFVIDPPTRLLAELELARTRLRRLEYKPARRSANRLLSILDADFAPELLPSGAITRMSELRAEGLGVRAIAASQLGRDDAGAAIDESLRAYEELEASDLHFRPSALAGYGMVLALGHHDERAVEPLVRAAEAGENVLAEVVSELAHRLVVASSPALAVELLRAAHERYPSELSLAVALADACLANDQPAAAADALVAVGALLAENEQYGESSERFRQALELVHGHPLATLGLGQALLADGHTVEAMEMLDRVRGSQPHLAGVHAVSALALARAGQRQEALRAIDEGQEAFPDDPWLLDTRVRLLLGAGDEWGALEAIDHALEVDPTDRIWRSLRAEIQLRVGAEPDEAVATLRELAIAEPDSVGAVARLVRALLVVGRGREALQVVERAVSEHPDDHTLVASQIRVLSALGRHREAIAQVSAASGMAIPRSLVAVPLAESQFALGNYEEALAAASDASPSDAGSGRLNRVEGIALHRLGRDEEAIDHLTAALTAADGDDDEATEALATALTKLAADARSAGDGVGARELLERALGIDPRNVRARSAMADLLRGQHDYVGALEQADIGLETDPDNAWLLGTRGQILEALGEDMRAEDDLRRTIELDPGISWARAELGDLLRIKGKYTEAIDHLAVAIEATPGDPWPLASMGAAEYALDHYDEAMRLLRRSLDLADKYAWAYCVAGSVLTDVDELPAAAADLRRGLELDPSMGWAWSQLGWVLLLQAFDAGDDRNLINESVEAHLRSLDLQDRTLAELMNLGEAYAVDGQSKRAAALFEEGIRAAAAGRLDADHMAMLGWCHLRLGRTDEAIDALVRAISTDTGHVSAAFDLALALLCARRTDVAVEEYKQAIARVGAVPHPGRRRALVHVARRDLHHVTEPQLDGRDEVGNLLEVPDGEDAHEGGDDDDGRDRAGNLQVP
jgi:tetratricopeptide (TPR) repeat protein